MKRERRRISIEPRHFNQPFSGSTTGVIVGFISSFPAQIAAAALGLNFGLEDPWPTLIIGGVIAGALVGGLLGYRMGQLKREANLLAILLVLVAGLGGSLLIAGINRAGGITFSCQRLEPAQIDCHLVERRWWGGATQREESFKNVQTAKIEPLSGNVGELVVLVTAQDEIGLYGFELGLADQLKRFIDSTQPTFTLEQNDGSALLLAIAVGGFLFLGGCAGAWGTWLVGNTPTKLSTTQKPARLSPARLPLEKLARARPFEIVEQTPTKLVLQVNPEKPGVIFGLVLLLIGLCGAIPVYVKLDFTRSATWVTAGVVSLIAGPFIFLGLSSMISYSQTEISTFDKVQNRMVINRPGWFGREVVEQPLSEIVEIKRGVPGILVLLNSGHIIGLRSGGGDPKMVELINRFLNISSNDQ